MWEVAFGDEFDEEFEELPQPVQDELLASAQLLGSFGPQLGRPHADTLNDSAFSNMKELRFEADGVWRVAFAFDPERKAMLLVAGNKSGGSEKRFYKSMIKKADERYRAHLERLTSAKRRRNNGTQA